MAVNKDKTRREFAARLLQAMMMYAGAPPGRALRGWAAKRFGVTAETVRKWEAGLTVPDAARMLEVAAKLDVNAEWLLSGTGSMRPTPQHQAMSVNEVGGIYRIQPETRPEGYIRFPLLEIEGGMGLDRSAEDFTEVVQHLDMAEWWARLHLPKPYSRIALITGRGDSNAGLIEHGDIVFVDTLTNFFDGEGLYVFNWNGRALIKRLKPNLRTNTLMILSANKAYDPEEITLQELDNLHISGRVVAWYSLKTS